MTKFQFQGNWVKESLNSEVATEVTNLKNKYATMKIYYDCYGVRITSSKEHQFWDAVNRIEAVAKFDETITK